ncbi:AraC family transcriptional regulator [Paenibacillus mesophilus]|uniref:AraC family transcriptional regulator n=1 Tax=Paenibacillus mesophilus TaxID=2582849 RepID=UPI00110F316F|nr:AraC family transcriptional regulator [Paenibacillus mesophilus]TMV48603.1 AraC family transcriptional regulator [Paenibacillus mesophilus]
MQIRTFDQYTFPSGYTRKSGGIHPYFEMLYVMQGKAVLEWRGCEYAAPSPSLFVLTPNTPHMIGRFETPFSFWYIEFDIGEREVELSDEQVAQWNRLQGNADYGSDELRPVKQTLDALSVSLGYKQKSGLYDEEIVKYDIRKTFRLLSNYLRTEARTSAEEKGKASRDYIQPLMRHMESRYRDPINLASLSVMVHLDSSYLVRAFKQETGVTPIQYLNSLRLSAAISYLANTDMGIERIAEATGFNSIHYFSRLFKQKVGISPRQWRTEQKDKASRSGFDSG